jgi:endopeptidase Clp ATP-binding regulatory subunit ClpX
MIGRREFITLLGGAATWPIAAEAQTRQEARRIGVLSSVPADDPEVQARMAAFHQGLQERGWIMRGVYRQATRPYRNGDTNILFVCGGVFNGLEKIISARGRSASIGFSAKVLAPEDRKAGEIFREVEPEDLLKYGLIPEFVGRLPVVATLEDLDEPSLKLILTQPKNALVKQYQRLFEMESIDLTLAEEALGAIARKAIDRKTGARGVRSIMEGILLDTMFDLPSLEGVEEVVIRTDRAGDASAS